MIDDREVVFDPKTDPAQECPFFNEWLDQTACGEGWGYCSIYARVMEDPNAELYCPKTGPRGGVKTEAPDECPLREFEVCLVRKKKS